MRGGHGGPPLRVSIGGGPPSGSPVDCDRGACESAIGSDTSGGGRRLRRKVPSAGDEDSSADAFDRVPLDDVFVIPAKSDGDSLKEGVSPTASGESGATAMGDEKDWLVDEK